MHKYAKPNSPFCMCDQLGELTLGFIVCSRFALGLGAMYLVDCHESTNTLMISENERDFLVAIRFRICPNYTRTAT
jgi:hypothetical protein